MAQLDLRFLDEVGEQISRATNSPAMGQAVQRFVTNTLTTTVEQQGDGSCFVITGDIPAMWLRDSAAQLKPLLYFCEDQPQLQELLAGLLKRHWAYIEIDPYANAFNLEPNGHGHQDDRTEQSPWLWERKWEIDSLCYGLDLAHRLWRRTGSTAWLTPSFAPAMRNIISVFRAEQDHEELSGYRFTRADCRQSDTLVRDGKGCEVVPNGMIFSAFRPSDDACEMGYNVPGNAFAVQALRYLETFARELLDDEELAAQAETVRRGVERGLREHAVVPGPLGEDVYAYEVDGKGGAVLMDDANVPSLLALPYFDFLDRTDAVYQATRRFLLSENNPTFYTGSAASGIGSPHTPPNYVWPISLAIQGLTAADADEEREILDLLLRTDGGTGMMHEGFDVNDPTKFTREWFSWANSMFVELALVHSGYGAERADRPDPLLHQPQRG